MEGYGGFRRGRGLLLELKLWFDTKSEYFDKFKNETPDFG